MAPLSTAAPSILTGVYTLPWRSTGEGFHIDRKDQWLRPPRTCPCVQRPSTGPRPRAAAAGSASSATTAAGSPAGRPEPPRPWLRGPKQVVQPAAVGTAAEARVPLWGAHRRAGRADGLPRGAPSPSSGLGAAGVTARRPTAACVRTRAQPIKTEEHMTRRGTSLGDSRLQAI